MGYADDKTEDALVKMEKAITKEYTSAYKEIREKAREYFGQFEARDNAMKEALANGTYPALKGASAGMTPEEHYKQWRLAQIGRGKQMEAMRDELAKKITDTNITAAAYVNDKTPGIFSLNHNYSAYQIEKQVGKGVSFNIYNEQSVRLLLEGENHTEFRTLRVNPKRDYAWNQQKVQSALTSGILQGKSTTELTDVFLEVMGSNRQAAVRNARTAVTSAQNAGVVEACKRAEDMGIEIEMQWRSAGDGRVRDSHAHLNGVRVKTDEKFPNGCRYPGDPQGRPEEVYNCRCTILKILPKYNGSTIESQHTAQDYKEWVEEKKASGAVVASRNNVENSESMKYTKRTEEEFTKAAEELKTAVEGYMSMPSKWQGKINVKETLEDNALGIKEWDCSISVVENADDGVLIHELIHSSSVSHAGEIAYANNQKMEEGSVEYLKQEICKLLGIESANTYDEQVTVLRVLNNRFEYGTDIEFAKELVNIPLGERYDWLEGRVDESLKEEGASFEDFNEVLDFVKKLKGAFEK